MIHDYLDGPKGEMTRLLERAREHSGLTDTAIRAIVRGSSVSRAGMPDPGQGTAIPFLIDGVAKLVCRVPDAGRLTIDFVGPGSFLCRPPVVLGPWIGAGISIVPHEGALTVSLVPRHVMAKVLADLPPANLTTFMSHVWRLGARTLYLKSALLTLRTSDRLVHELARLAVNMGTVESADWIRIGTPLTQGDVAQSIGRTRPRVNKPWKRLEEEGLIRIAAPYILVARTLLRRDARRTEQGRRVVSG